MMSKCVVALCLVALSHAAFLHSKQQGIFLPKDPPVNEKNMLATQEVTLFHGHGCSGANSTFSTSGNAFMGDFGKYINHLGSVKLCGKGTFFYFADPAMSMLSTLGHVSRCGDAVTKSMKECECADLPDETTPLVKSMTVAYC